jgi:hypothetical protein
MSSHSTSVASESATTTSHENTVTAIADKIGRNDLTADDQAEIDFWTAALEEHSNRAMLNISRQALAKLLGIIGKLRTEQREPVSQEARSIPPADHELKTWTEYYTALEQGVKTFEFRRDDRTPAYQVGDVLRLREWNNTFRRCQSSMCRSSGCMFPQACPGDHRVGYSGRECLRRVTYVARGGVIPSGFCIMSVEPLASGIPRTENEPPSACECLDATHPEFCHSGPAHRGWCDMYAMATDPARASVISSASPLSEKERLTLKGLREECDSGRKIYAAEGAFLLGLIDRLSASAPSPEDKGSDNG